MARKSVKSGPTAEPEQPLLPSKIDLTPVPAETGEETQPLSVNLSELIAYSQNHNRTRLNLTKGRTVEVAETTEQIDRLVRTAAAQIYSQATRSLHPPSDLKVSESTGH